LQATLRLCDSGAPANTWRLKATAWPAMHRMLLDGLKDTDAEEQDSTHV
jgi:hypothetical protein